MHKAIKGLFDEHDAPAHCCKADVVGANRPLLTMVANEQAQIARDRALLLDAETNPELPEDFRTKIELLHRELAVREQVAAAAVEVLRKMIRGQTQWDRAMAEAKHGLEAWEKNNGG